MDDWDRLTIEALRSLGADTDMIPGAKLRQRMVELGQRSDFDVATHVTSSTESFSKLVDRVKDVEVKVRPGSDVLVGLRGARAPTDTRQIGPEPRFQGLRKDVYEAFTRVASVPFVYLPGADKFVPESEADGASIAVASVTLNDLIKDRRSFIDTLPPDEQRPLIDALDGSPTPLSEFRQEAMARQVFGQWTTWQTQTVASRIREWANSNDLTVRTAWFRRGRATDTPHRTLARLVPYLTTDEIRDLRIPFRAIEALLSDQEDR